MAREVSLGKRPPWSRLSLPLSPPTTHGVHLAPSRLRAPTGAATCSSPAHGACALRRRDRMAPMVVAANSRGGYPRRPAEQRVNNEFMLGPRAAVARIAHQVQNGCRRSNAHLAGQDPPRPWPTPMAPMDGSNGTEASDCVDVPPVRLCDRPSRRATAVDRVLGSAGAVRSAASDQDARRVGLSPGARNTTQTAEQSSAQAHSSCEQVAGQRARSSAQAGGCARARAHTHTRHRATICEHGDHSYLLSSVCAGVSGAGR